MTVSGGAPTKEPTAARVFRTEDRVGLIERELVQWLDRLAVANKRQRTQVIGEIDRAIAAAKTAGLVIPGHEFQLMRVSP